MKRACLLLLALCAWTTLAAALAGRVNAGPQASAFLSPEAVQGGLATLRGNTRPEAMPTNDRGRVFDDLALNHLLLQLRRTPEREQALQQFIKDIHDPISPLFHHWISAEEFGRAYGASSAGIAAATSWLESQGFRVNLVYPNQMVIDFSGSAGQIRHAFHTEVHHLRVKGADHFANMSDPQVPAELAATVAGVVSLNDFRPRPMLQPRANFTVGDGGPLLVVPADLATIYNFNPAFAAGFSGQGQTIVVIEDADLYAASDWDTFRSVMGLASAYPLGSLAQVHPSSGPTNNCLDPGANGDDLEAAVDAEWASAGAPSAAIELASCASTETTWGGFVALQNLLNASGAPPAIVSISYGESESFLGATFNAYINSLYQQAVAEGVSVFASSGDEGATRSDPGEPFAQDGINVSGFTSTPYNVSVGGTDFADTYQRNGTAYWNPTNAADYRSALSYVPEIPWNDSCASVLRADFLGVLPTYGANSLCNSSGLTTVAGGGGPSGCATGAPDVNGIVSGTCAGYAKPLWQSGFIGNPRDGVRDIPDVSLFASNGAWDHYYVVCISDPSYNSNCAGTPDTWFGAGGTSFSAPIMAGVQALVNQASGSRWGNPNPAYYTLAAAEYGAGGATSCNSALGNTAAASCVFYDVTQIPLLYSGVGTGGDIDVPCLGVNCYLPSGNYGVLSTAPQTLNYAYVASLGSGYTSAPSCTLSGGGGSGAACSATLTGQVSSLTLTNGGTGYDPAGTTCTLTGGGGAGAHCVLSVFETGEIYQIYLTDRGSGYTSAPTCTIGGGGTGATCIAAEEVGPVVSLTAGGSGYTTAPHCVLSGGGGTGATCAALALNTSDEYQPAFGAGTGWDFATGIGTVNASNLVASFLSYSAALSSLNLAFPPQALYTSSTAQSVTVTNTGTAKLGILGVGVGGTNPGDFAKTLDTCTGVPVAPLSSCKVSVTFTPAYVGNRSASLNFIGIAPRSSQAVTLSGFGMGAGASLSPTSLTFPDQVAGTSATQTVTLANPGNVPLALTSIAITGNNRGDFAQTSTCGSTVAPGANCAIKVTFTPGALGSESAALTITDNALDSPQRVSLAGSAAIPVPFINQPLVPTSVAPGGAGFTLTVAGTGFASGATVHWNGVALATSYVSSEELKATVPAASIALPGTAWVTVFNPGSTLVSNMLPFPVTASAPTVAFSNASGSPIATGTTPMSVVTGDFNGDGKLDLAVANANADNVAILLGNGDGTFTPAASSPRTGCIPYAIAVGDFNGDGKLDIASANGGSDDVTILLGNGDGTLTPAAESPTAGTVPWALAVGDFNGDGKLDLAVANQFSNNVTILLGNGDGTFTPAAASPAAGPQPTGIAVGDFNADGKLDLAVTNELGDNLTILLGNGDGTFTPAPASPLAGFDPYGLAVGDFNGDGKLDLAVANAGSNNVTILLGNGDGTFTPAAVSPATGAEPLGVAVGDFNADGKLDLAVTNQNNQVTILLGNGDGTFTPTASSPATGALPWAVAVGDFKGDGRLDLAIANASSNNATIMLQLSPAQVAGVSPLGLTFGNQTLTTISASQPVTLSNTGAAPLTITSIVTSASFSETNNCGRSIAAGGSCTINVTFAPTAAGSLAGALTITDNSQGVAGSTQSVSLSGTGTGPVVSLSPSSLSFPAEIVETSGNSQTVTLANTGNASLAISSITAGGDFSQTNTCGATVSAGANCAISVTFKPLAAGTRTGALIISNNPTGAPQSVALSGTGLVFTVGPDPPVLSPSPPVSVQAQH
ncbi:MAG: FG-GAP-like repeat-containing protein [Terriglobia bacterium]